MDIETAYRELADQVEKGEQLLKELNPAEGPTWKHLEWGESVKTIIAYIDPNGEIFDKSSPVGMFYDGWNLATFHWTDIEEKIQNRRNTDGFAQALGALKAIVKFRPAPRRQSPREALAEATRGSDIFLIHGHDTGARECVARFIESLGLRVCILHEMENQGQTIIEKIEHYSNVGFAVALLTSDDLGGSKTTPEQRLPRARQNVVFEFGYFIGKLGRSQVCALVGEGIERPSDLDGIVYIPLDRAAGWKLALAREIRKSGLQVDLNKAI
ncbi:MAG: nucleotide-binding protein [Armatimonadota bacterium]|nr:nucleotide-binding protein [Armatimonadota bacterium]